MKTISTEQRTVHTPGGILRLRYRLLSQQTNPGIWEYGVAIAEEDGGEESRVLALTTDEARARDFWTRLIHGQVTPVTLHELAEDFVAEDGCG